MSADPIHRLQVLRLRSENVARTIDQVEVERLLSDEEELARNALESIGEELGELLLEFELLIPMDDDCEEIQYQG